VRTSNNAFEVGQRLDNLPENSVSLWTSYRFAERFEIGGGVQFVDERVSDIRQSGSANIPITAPDYTVFDAVVEWELTNEVQLRLNLYNLTDEEYTQSLASAQSIPGARRSAVLTLDLEF
jgi:catecholate siderophore receptor